MAGSSASECLRITDVFREINGALVAAESRTQLEADVCDVFATSEPYVFAWIGVRDAATDEVVPRTAAGVGDDYLEEISITVHGADSREGPTATAVRTGSVQTVQNIREDPTYERWREQALDRGFQSSAAVPLSDGSNQYGVLNVYAGRPDAFDESEKRLLAEAGETIATAIAGVEARTELQSRKRKYERLTERISDAHYAVDDEWRVTYWNEQMARRVETPASEVRGEVLWEAFPEALGTDVETELRAAMETNEPRSFEFHAVEAGYWTEIDVYPDENGLSVFSREITERKERERELERNRDFLQHTQAVVDLGGWEVDLEAETLRWTDGVYRIHDLPLDYEPTVSEGLEFYHPEDRAVIETAFDQLTEAGEPYDLELRIVTAADEVRWVRTIGVPRYEDDEIVGVRGVFQDITERKERERELQSTKNTLEAIIEAAPDPIVMLDEELRVTRWNPGAERVFGWTEDEILGERAPFVPEEKRAEFDALVENLDRGQQNRFIDTVRRTKDGERIDVGISSAKVDTDAVTGYVGVFKDIRQRMQYERQIEALHDSTRKLLETETKREAAGAIVEAAEDLLEFPVPSVWYPSDDGSTLELVASSDEHRQLLTEAGVTSPTHPRGDWLWEVYERGETVVRDAIEPEEKAADVPLASAVVVPLGEHGLLACAARDDAEFDEDVVTLTTLLGQNATAALDRIERETELKEQRDDLELLEQMVRHDIRNDLQVISGFAEALDRRADEADRPYLEKIVASTNRAVELTESARDLAEVMLRAGSERKPVGLRTTLQAEIDEIRGTYSDAVVTVDGELADVRVLANEMLSSLFRNLLANAVEHNDKDVPEVSVSVVEREGEAVVRVADNGPGIPDDRKEAVFGKGQKGLESAGTGIGLYLVHTLVERYGGSVRVEDNDPVGSVFVVELPTVE